MFIFKFVIGDMYHHLTIKRGNFRSHNFFDYDGNKITHDGAKLRKIRVT